MNYQRRARRVPLTADGRKSVKKGSITDPMPLVPPPTSDKGIHAIKGPSIGFSGTSN
uniref:Uncharacterized protein n=1 Tax=Solanum tuberosum TaxID=4113 RepID=M1AH15_SOLTU